ncbi:MAG: AAA family ATPase, partial [Acidimicrobiia bacterium]
LDQGELLGVALRERPAAVVLAAELQWLDRELVGRLHEAGIATVVVDSGCTERPVDRIGASCHLPSLAGPEEILAAISSLRPQCRRVRPEPASTAGSLVAVWGAAGSPGRTAVALHLAVALVSRRRRVVLVDGDAWAPSIAQAVDVSPFPSVTRAARLASDGWHQPLGSCLQEGPKGVRILAGLARPDLWLEVRQRAWRGVLDACREEGEATVIDLAAPLEEDEELSFDDVPYRRNVMTRTTLEECDHLLFVIRADPVGVRRAVLAWRELEELIPDARRRARVVMNGAPRSAARCRELVAELDAYVGLAPAAWLPQESALGDTQWTGKLLDQVAPASPWLAGLRALALAVAP